MSIRHVTLEELADEPVVNAITVRGRELTTRSTVADARALFESRSVKVIPVLDGDQYVGAVGRDDVEGVADDEPALRHARATPPVATSITPTRRAVELLDEDGGSRLVVVAEDGRTYLGLLCLRGDRQGFCVDADCRPA